MKLVLLFFYRAEYFIHTNSCHRIVYDAMRRSILFVLKVKTKNPFDSQLHGKNKPEIKLKHTRSQIIIIMFSFITLKSQWVSKNRSQKRTRTHIFYTIIVKISNNKKFICFSYFVRVKAVNIHSIFKLWMFNFCDLLNGNLLEL